jgi:hypothetical protein
MGLYITTNANGCQHESTDGCVLLRNRTVRLLVPILATQQFTLVDIQAYQYCEHIILVLDFGTSSIVFHPNVFNTDTQRNA